MAYYLLIILEDAINLEKFFSYEDREKAILLLPKLYNVEQMIPLN